MTSTIIPTDIPTPGTPAYWTAQREGVALVDAYAFSDPDPSIHLESLRRIAAHGFAARIMAAHRKPVASWIRDLERIVAAIDAACFGEDDTDPDAPPPGSDWCSCGCQILHGMECGICGYDGPGVRADAVSTVAEHCCHCRARTYHSPEGICELYGKDAEDAADTPTAAGSAPGACPDPDHHAQPAVADARDTPNGSAPATVGARLPELATAIERHRQDHAANFAAIRQRMQRNGDDEEDVPF